MTFNDGFNIFLFLVVTIQRRASVVSVVREKKEEEEEKEEEEKEEEEKEEEGNDRESKMEIRSSHCHQAFALLPLVHFE